MGDGRMCTQMLNLMYLTKWGFRRFPIDVGKFGLSTQASAPLANGVPDQCASSVAPCALGWPSPVSFTSHITTPRRGMGTARAIRPIQIRAMAFPPLAIPNSRALD